jgi:hypothetical protein
VVGGTPGRFDVITLRHETFHKGKMFQTLSLSTPIIVFVMIVGLVMVMVGRGIRKLTGCMEVGVL